MWLLLAIKIKGQREIGRLNAFDFIVAVTFGSIAASALSNSEIGLQGPLITIISFVLLDVLMSYIALKNIKLRRIVQDEPLVIVQNGRIIENMMYRARLNIDDLMMELRQKKIPNLNDVEFAILESNGKISIIPKSQYRMVQPRDLKINTEYEGLPTILIEDGNIINDNLKKSGLSREWLFDELKKKGFDSPNNILIALLDTTGRLYLSEKNEKFIH